MSNSNTISTDARLVSPGEVTRMLGYSHRIAERIVKRWQTTPGRVIRDNGGVGRGKRYYREDVDANIERDLLEKAGTGHSGRVDFGPRCTVAATATDRPPQGAAPSVALPTATDGLLPTRSRKGVSK